MPRRWDLDALRGLMLVLMTVTHLPTAFAEPLGQPIGLVSAAEGFVLLSAYMAGMVYTLRARRDGMPEMTHAFLRRAFTIYACQVALLAFLFVVVVNLDLLSDHVAIGHLTGFYRQNPPAAIAGAALLLYNPPLLDILPIYILFMLLSPMVLQRGLRTGFGRLLAASLALWAAAQLGLGGWLYAQAVSTTGLPVPPSETGSFSVLGWQLLWVLGLWMGAVSAQRPGHVTRIPPWLWAAAAAYAVGCLVLRHNAGQVPFGSTPALAPLFDKWHLGPLRLLNVLALLVLTMRFGPWLTGHVPRVRFLEVLGAASLPVFCAHLVLALLALAWLGDPAPSRAPWVDPALLAGSFAVLYGVARLTQAVDRRKAAVRERVSSAWARSRTATRRSPGH